jgi:hypothetical protein
MSATIIIKATLNYDSLSQEVPDLGRDCNLLAGLNWPLGTEQPVREAPLKSASRLQTVANLSHRATEPQPKHLMRSLTRDLATEPQMREHAIFHSRGAIRMLSRGGSVKPTRAAMA